MSRTTYDPTVQASVSPQVIEALTRRFGAIIPIGAGAWSTAFRFSRRGQPLVVRVGPHHGDFEIDAEMAAFSSPDLPIPAVLELERLEPPHDELWVCVSTFAPGRPLEHSSPTDWAALVPRIADLLDAMRRIEPTTSAPSWPSVLMDQHDDDDDGRLDGWRDSLGSLPESAEAHARLMRRLGQLCERPEIATVRPTLLHRDLVNRNVHTVGDSITGVFDWGCRLWGDHLYDLAWLEFWNPWFPSLDTSLVRQELERRWGHPADPVRLEACTIHIAAGHLVYNAVIGDRAAGTELLAHIERLGLLDSAA